MAGSWSLHCVNDSCEAAQGRLKVYWSGMGDLNLTGVEGIPISIEDFEAAEKKIEQVFEKSITSKKSGESGAKAGSPDEIGYGPSAGVTGNKERAFTKKRSMSQTKTMGKKVSVDYTLVFVKWLGDMRFANRNGGYREPIGRYWAAAEYAMQAYMNGTIQPLVESFFFARNADRIEDVVVDEKLNNDNRDLIMTKYIGLTEFPAIEDAKERYSAANSIVSELLYSNNKVLEIELERINAEFSKHMEQLKILMKPNQTALKLYEKNKELAFVKWLADTKELKIFLNITNVKDRYITVLAGYDSQKKQSNISGFPSDWETAKKFEELIKNKDKDVQTVTVHGSPIPVIPIAVVAGIGLIAGVVIYIRKRKGSKKEAGNV